MRDIIFISHATPEDNEFAIWIASRLSLLGYAVWVDRRALLGGEVFWNEIDQIIREKAAKVLVVYSDSTCVRPGKLKDGMSKELSLAESIAKQHDISDFVLLAHIDDSPHNLFIGADRLNHVPFNKNWAEGLDLLVQKLEKDAVPNDPSLIDPTLFDWYKNEYTVREGIVSKKELYYSNYWSIARLPNCIFLYQFTNENQAKKVQIVNSQYPVIRIGNVLSTFDKNLNLVIDLETESLELSPSEIHTVSTAQVLSGDVPDGFPGQKDCENHLKKVLQRSFHLLMKSNGLFWEDMANKRQAYFYPKGRLHKNKTKFNYPHRKSGKRSSKTKSLVGKHLSLGHWHFAISSKVVFEPVLAYSLRSHIVFTTDGMELWEDKDKMHSHRRRKGRRMFNEEWRDLLLAFISSLARHTGEISLDLNDKDKLILQRTPEMIWSDFGYFEPSNKGRHDVLHDYEDEIQE